MSFPPAPDTYDRGIWQLILEAVRQALQGAFVSGRDLRLMRGERLSLKSPGGDEIFFTVDDLGNLLTPTAGVEYAKADGGATLTIAAPGFYAFTGTTATWTLPAVAGHTGWKIRVKNRGSGNLIIVPAGTDHIYTSASVTTMTVRPGETTWLENDGTFWDAQLVRAVFG